MFIQDDKNYYCVNRGDSYTLPLVINEGTKLNFSQYQLRQFDKIYVGIMECGQSFENAIIRKVLTIMSPTDKQGHPLLRLKPSDTENLLVGKYFIEIKLVQQVDGEDCVTTIMPLKEFFIEGTNKEIQDENVYKLNKHLTTEDNDAQWSKIKHEETEDAEIDYEWIPIKGG